MSGGVAAYKSCYLVRLLTQEGAVVTVAMTPAATRFVGPETFAALSGRGVYTDLFTASGEVPHVRLAHAADVVVVAPATANLLAKMALGFADDLVSSTLLEVRCPLVVAPAMHSGMYENGATQENLAILAARGVTIVGPDRGPLAAGDEGLGRMVDPEAILAAVASALGRGRDLEGRRILVTAGPTWEPIDPVRFIGNRSSGKMGVALAAEAAARGAEVLLVLGPGTVAPPQGVETVHVTSAEEMRDETIAAFDGTNCLIMAAAVADFRPASAARTKLKKSEGPPELELVPNPDILSELGGRKTHQVLVGFAAETEDLEAAGREKLHSKSVDLIVVNRVGREGTGFGTDTDEAMILASNGEDEPLRMWTKIELAREIVDRVAKLLSR